jgi:hypothetical protein
LPEAYKVDEPTDRALSIQGLSRRDYDGLAPEGKEMIASRSRKVVELSDITLIADLLNTIAESDEDSRAFVADIIDGKHPEFEDRIRHLIREYLNAKVESSIKDYYKIKYGGTDFLRQPHTEVKKDYSGLASKSPPMGQNDSAAAQRSPASQTADVAVNPAAAQPQPEATVKPAHDIQPPKQVPVQVPSSKGASAQERASGIAQMISQSEKRDPESVMRIDADIIKTIMTITDENAQSGVTDESVYKAAQAMITDGKGVQFFMEALMSANRARLLEIAKVMN